MTSTLLIFGARELDHRRADGIDVRLLWIPERDRVVVAVDDTKTGDSFEIDVLAGERALDVFHHPYAYAALRSLGDAGAVALAAA